MSWVGFNVSIYSRVLSLLVVTLIISGCGVQKTVKGYFGGTDNTEPPSPLVDIVVTADINRVWS